MGGSSTSSHVAVHVDCRCRWCELMFMPVGWLAWRTEGYCSERCMKDAVKASESAEAKEPS